MIDRRNLVFIPGITYTYRHISMSLILNLEDPSAILSIMLKDALRELIVGYFVILLLIQNRKVFLPEYKMILLSDRLRVYRNQTWHEFLMVNNMKIIVARL